MDSDRVPGTLNDISEAVRTQETRALLQKLDATLNFENLNIEATLGSAATFREIIRQLRRARDLFRADLFFVVIFGALKSGKSTLTNSLVEDEISPMGYGRDTTQRPCLILRGTEKKCCQFFVRQSNRRPSPEDTQESQNTSDVRSHAFDLVSDHLKGVVDPERFKLHVEKQEFPFSDLERRLTTKIDSSALEPLITVVWVTTGSFLEKGICLIDMPGLDSVDHNAGADSIHDWVIDDADFFLFLQSSVAALNERTQQFLRRIHDSRKQQPMWALQNVLDARYWRDGTTRLEEFEMQRKGALEKIHEVLKGSREHLPKSQWFNLGLEWDGIAENNPDWRSESKFSEFKEAVTQQLANERGHIKERNCLENLNAAIRKSLLQIAVIRQDQGTILRECEYIENIALNELPKEISKLTYFTEERLNMLRKTLSHDLDKQFAFLESQIDVKSKERCAKVRQVAKSELEKVRKEYVGQLNTLVEKVFSFEGEFQNNLDLTTRSQVEASENDPNLRTIESNWNRVDSSSSIVSSLKSVRQPELPVFKCSVDVPLDCLSNYAWGLKWMEWLAESTIDPDRVKTMFEDTTEEFRKKAKELFETWKLGIAQPFREYDSNRREMLKSKVTAESMSVLERRNPKKKAAKAAIEFCDDIENIVADIQPLLENASASV